MAFTGHSYDGKDDLFYLPLPSPPCFPDREQVPVSLNSFNMAPRGGSCAAIGHTHALCIGDVRHSRGAHISRCTAAFMFSLRADFRGTHPASVPDKGMLSCHKQKSEKSLCKTLNVNMYILETVYG